MLNLKSPRIGDQRVPLTLDQPPPTPVKPVTDVVHGVAVTDPYRWLEDQNSPLTRKWLEEQTGYTPRYLYSIPGRDRITNRVRELLSNTSLPHTLNVDAPHFFL